MAGIVNPASWRHEPGEPQSGATTTRHLQPEPARRRALGNDQHTNRHPPHRPPTVRRRRRARRRRPVGSPLPLDPPPPRGRLVHLDHVPRRSTRARRERTHAGGAPRDERNTAPGRAHPPRRPRHPNAHAEPATPRLGPRASRHRAADDERVHRSPRLRSRRPALRKAGHHAWASLNLLSELDPTVITDVDARYVDDGDLITSAGVSAGIDIALHLVARLAGTERARDVRRGIQYDPQPPI